MISVFQSWTSIGSLVGTVIDNGTAEFDGKSSYLIPLGTVYIVPVLISIGLFFIPESPRWLALMERNEQAQKSLMWMRPHPEGVQEELDDIQAAILAEKKVSGSASFIDIWRNPVDRRRTLLAIAAISIQAASGAMFMIGTGPYLLTDIPCMLENDADSGESSVRNLLFQDGWNHRCFQNVLRDDCCGRDRDTGQQLRYLEDWTPARISYGRNEYLRRLSVHRRCCIPCFAWYCQHWKSKFPEYGWR
jgi:hypothetical protein